MGSLNFDALYEVYDKICIQNKAESHKDASLEQFGQMFNLTFLGEFPGWFEKMSAVKVSTPLTVQAGVRGKIMEVFANGGKAA